jgi:hypothetical protein
MVDAMVRDLADYLPAEFKEFSQQSAEIKALIEASYKSWY